jgi:hypothetical protein
MTYDAASSVPYGAPTPSTPDLLNDGDDGTRTGWNGGYAGPQSTAIWRSDLGEARDVFGFVVLSDWEASAYPSASGMILFQFSDDGSSWTDCTCTFVSAEVYAATKWRSFWTIDAGFISHRYWRLRMTTHSGGGYHRLGWVYTWCIVGTE